jgi:proline racemase
MRWSKTLQTVDVHCEGEIGKVITAGVLDLPGKTMAEKMDYLNKVDDSLRRFVVFEPRGKAQASVNLLLPPTRPEADAGFIILQADEAHPMSGSNCICVVTCLLETGLLPMTEPETIVTLDTPAGLVRAAASCRDGKCESVSLNMMPAFVEALDLEIATEAWGKVTGDVAFGGCYYALVDADQLGLAIAPDQARELVEAGMALKPLFDAARDVAHPEIPSIDHIAYLMFRQRDPDGTYRTATIMAPGRVDRSPCGTGSSANLACLHARGEVVPGDRIASRSIIGSRFGVDCLGTTEIGGKVAVLPRITGRGWVFGFQQMALDPTDPYPLGFALSDTWGPDVGGL